jgi:hypothetical protein
MEMFGFPLISEVFHIRNKFRRFLTLLVNVSEELFPQRESSQIVSEVCSVCDLRLQRMDRRLLKLDVLKLTDQFFLGDLPLLALLLDQLLPSFCDGPVKIEAIIIDVLDFFFRVALAVFDGSFDLFAQR